ncbi:hypothetical protein ACRAWF_27415 [Streptomyces sp. L7]
MFSALEAVLANGLCVVATRRDATRAFGTTYSSPIAEDAPSIAVRRSTVVIGLRVGSRVPRSTPHRTPLQWRLPPSFH